MTDPVKEIIPSKKLKFCNLLSRYKDTKIIGISVNIGEIETRIPFFMFPLNVSEIKRARREPGDIPAAIPRIKPKSMCSKSSIIIMF